MADYSFQGECLKKMSETNVGQIILPTGAGKSRIEFEHATSKMVRDDWQHQVVVIVAPRIILCQQLIRNFVDFLAKRYGNVDEILTFVSSGTFPSDMYAGKTKIKGVYTTDAEQIAHDIKLAKQNNKDNIIISTYKSFGQCIKGVKMGIDEFSTVHLIADEAHYFTRNHESDTDIFKVLNDNIDMFASRFFFTATPKYSGAACETGSAMNNSKVYGPVIYTKKPKELIKSGIICEPRLHNIGFSKAITEENFSKAAGDFILQAFDKHQEIIKANCGDVGLKETIGAKVLVAVDGSEQLNDLLHNGFVQKANAKGIQVYHTMSHQDIGAGSNSNIKGGVFKKEDLKIGEFLKDINKCGQNSSEKMIILHYNQLTEGIDIPAMTGLIVLRGMIKERAVQSIGRVLRVHSSDKDKDVGDKSGWIKPYSYIIVPNLEATNDFNELVEYLREDYCANIKVEMSDTASGMTEAQPEMQSLSSKNTAFKIIDAALVHEVEGFEKALDEQEQTGYIDLNFKKAVVDNDRC